MSDASIIRAQRERIDYLEEEVRQLREMLTEETWQAPRCLKLTRVESRIVGVLMGVGQTTADRLRWRLYGDKERSKPLIYVHISHVRTKLWSHRITVGKLYGLGLYLSPKDKAKIRAMVAQEQGR